MSQIKPQTVVITGSTSGIGRSIALHLARAHYQVVLNYSSDEEKAQKTLALCREVTEHVLLVKADVSQKGEVDHLIRMVIGTFGTLDALINNAARVQDKPLIEMSEEEWDQVVDVNMKGTFLCSQAAAHVMLQQEAGGSILNIGASTGIKGRRNGINTCASKAGIMVMTKCLALELGPKIRINTIIPGLTLTEEVIKRYQLDDPTNLQARTASIPLQRATTPEEIAQATLFLLSDAAKNINGSKLVIDGGESMW